MPNYQCIQSENGVPIKAWVQGVPLDERALLQVQNAARLPIIHSHIALMPDVHWGIGATVGSVIPTIHAVIPAAVGVDIGCGMIAQRTTLRAKDLPDNLKSLREAIEQAVPHGRTNEGRRGDKGAWHRVPQTNQEIWEEELGPRLRHITTKHPNAYSENNINHLGTLGTGNHFIEVCLDENQAVWVMLHSGSRGIGNRIGTYFIELAKKDMREHLRNLPDRDLAYLKEGTTHFDDYVEAVHWAQDFAMINRRLMMTNITKALLKILPPFRSSEEAVNCHHNYLAREHHFGKDVIVTRKGAVSARRGELGIIPGSMGTKSYIVQGLGNADSFESCSHGAGRVMSRNEAKRTISLEAHLKATEGIECRKDRDVIDESPAAYKPIDAVMEAQKDLVEIIHTLKQIVCVKG